MLLAWFWRIQGLSCSCSVQQEPQAGCCAQNTFNGIEYLQHRSIPRFLLFLSLFAPSRVYQPPANDQNPPGGRERVAEERKFHESHINIPAPEHAAPQGPAWTNCAGSKRSSQNEPLQKCRKQNVPGGRSELRAARDRRGGDTQERTIHQSTTLISEHAAELGNIITLGSSLGSRLSPAGEKAKIGTAVCAFPVGTHSGVLWDPKSCPGCSPEMGGGERGWRKRLKLGREGRL